MKKVTILFGAGAALPWKAPNTEMITEAIKNSKDHLIGKESFGNWIDNFLRNDTRNRQNRNNVNFESYVDFIESVWSYLHETDTEIYSSLKSNLYRAFELRSEIAVEIKNMVWANNSNFNSDTSKIVHTYYSFIRIIENQVGKYLSNYETVDEKNRKLKLCFEHFIKTGYSIRSYSLNYDRSVPLVFENSESPYEIFDGFDIRYYGEDEKEKKDLFVLNKSRILNDTNSHSFYNLHGSFHYSFQECEYKGYKNFLPFTLMSSKKYQNRLSHSYDIYSTLANSNPNEKLLLSNIITGFKKIQRINLEPFNYFFHSFFNDIQVSEIIIVIGYSYSDPHINYLLNDANRRNVRIYNVSYRSLSTEELTNGYMSKSGIILKNHYPDLTNWFKDLEFFYSEYIKGFESFLLDDEWLNIQPF